MIIAEVGSMRKVSGKRMDTAAVVPMPGKMPTTVPTVTPIKQNNRFAGSKAVWKPCKRFVTTSMASKTQRPDGKRHREQTNKKQIEACARSGRYRNGAEPTLALQLEEKNR